MDRCAEITRNGDSGFGDAVRRALRGSAVNVLLLTTRDRKGHCHGLAVTTAVPFCSKRPAMIVAVRQTASAYPAIRESGRFCLNQVSIDDMDLLNRFSRSDLRASRFTTSQWTEGPHGLPCLAQSALCFFCDVQGAHGHEDQTVFIGRIEAVRLAKGHPGPGRHPLVWINGRAAGLVEPAYI